MAIGLSLIGCAERSAVKFEGPTQGTTYHITVVADQPAQVEVLQPAVEKRLAAIDTALSSYNNQSELSHFNAAPVGQWVDLGADLYHVLRTSQTMSELSGGAFDVTVADLVDLWGFGPNHKPERVPSAEAIAQAKQNIGYHFLELDPNLPRARKLRDLHIDVNGIAQGYTVDAVAAVLAAMGYKNFLVEVGGELKLEGVSPRGTPWRVGIEAPSDGLGPVQQAIEGRGIGITTAGDYHEYFEQDGKRYSHTIDPTTGAPITHKLASVTVIAATAEYADGMDTVLEVLGPERGFALAEQLGVAAYFIIRGEKGFEMRYTKACKPYLAQ